MGIWNISLYNAYLKPNPFMTELKAGYGSAISSFTGDDFVLLYALGFLYL